MSEWASKIEARLAALEGRRVPDTYEQFVARMDRSLGQSIDLVARARQTYPLSDSLGSAAAVQAAISASSTRNLFTTITPVVSQNDASEHNLIAITIAAGQLAASGDRISGVFAGTTAANATTKRLRLYFGATVIFDTTIVILNATDWGLRFDIIRTGAATQTAVGEFFGDVATVTTTALYTTPAETLSGTVVLKATSQQGVGAAASDVVNKFATVDYFPHGSVA